MNDTNCVVLAICNHKGGTGKTTTVLNLGTAIGLAGFRVLLVDVDPQGFLTRMASVAEPPPSQSTLRLYSHTLEKGDIKPAALSACDIIPASRHMAKHLRRLNKPTDCLWISESLTLFDEYDLIILDTAAADTTYSLSALVAASVALIPITPEVQGVHGAESVRNTITVVRESLNPHLPDPLFLLTQVDGRKIIHRKYAAYMRTKYKDRVLTSVIRTNAALARAYTGGSTVFECQPRSRGVMDYANAADEVITYLQSHAGLTTRVQV